MMPLPPWLTLRFAATFVIALGLFAVGWKAGATLTEARWQRVQVKAEREHTTALARAREAERASYAKAVETSRAYQTSLAAIRAERDRLRDLPPRVVRVYVPAKPASVPAPGAAAGGPGSAAAAAVELAGEAGSGARFSRDIGPTLYGIVDDSDEREAALAEQVRKLQEWAVR